MLEGEDEQQASEGSERIMSNDDLIWAAVSRAARGDLRPMNALFVKLIAEDEGCAHWILTALMRWSNGTFPDDRCRNVHRRLVEKAASLVTTDDLLEPRFVDEFHPWSEGGVTLLHKYARESLVFGCAVSKPLSPADAVALIRFGTDVAVGRLCVPEHLSSANEDVLKAVAAECGVNRLLSVVQAFGLDPSSDVSVDVVASGVRGQFSTQYLLHWTPISRETLEAYMGNGFSSPYMQAHSSRDTFNFKSGPRAAAEDVFDGRIARDAFDGQTELFVNFALHNSGQCAGVALEYADLSSVIATAKSVQDLVGGPEDGTEDDQEGQVPDEVVSGWFELVLERRNDLGMQCMFLAFSLCNKTTWHSFLEGDAPSPIQFDGSPLPPIQQFCMLAAHCLPALEPADAAAYVLGRGRFQPGNGSKLQHLPRLHARLASACSLMLPSSGRLQITPKDTADLYGLTFAREDVAFKLCAHFPQATDLFDLDSAPVQFSRLLFAEQPLCASVLGTGLRSTTAMMESCGACPALVFTARSSLVDWTGGTPLVDHPEFFLCAARGFVAYAHKDAVLANLAFAVPADVELLRRSCAMRAALAPTADEVRAAVACAKRLPCTEELQVERLELTLEIAGMVLGGALQDEMLAEQRCDEVQMAHKVQGECMEEQSMLALGKPVHHKRCIVCGTTAPSRFRLGRGLYCYRCCLKEP